MTLTVKQVAERYGVGERTIVGFIRSGELRAVNLGRKPGSKKPRWRIPPDALEAFELIRAASPPVPKVGRRKRQPGGTVIEFYR